MSFSFNLTTLVEALVAGTLLSGIYAAMAIGLGLVWGIMKILNISHAALALLGAYIVLTLMTSFGVDPVAGLLISVPVLFGIGAGLQKLVVDPLSKRRNFETQTFLVLYGVMIIVENLSVYFWTTDVQLISPAYAREVWSVGFVSFPVGRVITFLLGMSTVGIVYAVLRWTRVGLAVRAIGFDREATGLMGVNVSKMSTLAFGIGVSTAATAGLGLGLVSSFFPGLQIIWVAKAFLVVVLGGVTNIPGILLAAFILGLAESIVGVTAPTFVSTFVAYALLIGVLMLRPQGLLAKKA